MERHFGTLLAISKTRSRHMSNFSQPEYDNSLSDSLDVVQHKLQELISILMIHNWVNLLTLHLRMQVPNTLYCTLLSCDCAQPSAHECLRTACQPGGQPTPHLAASRTTQAASPAESASDGSRHMVSQQGRRLQALLLRADSAQ